MTDSFQIPGGSMPSPEPARPSGLVARAGLAVVLVATVLASLAAIFLPRERGPRVDLSRYNFGVVSPGKIYRSEIPDVEMVAHLADAFGLRSVLYIHDQKKEDYMAEMGAFCAKRGIRFETGLAMPGSYPTDLSQVLEILRFVADERNQPVLIHCHGGENRTGMISGIIRKKQGIREGLILSEYFRYARDGDGLQASHLRNTVFLVKFYRQGMGSIRDLEFPPPPDPAVRVREEQAGL